MPFKIDRDSVRRPGLAVAAIALQPIYGVAHPRDSTCGEAGEGMRISRRSTWNSAGPGSVSMNAESVPHQSPGLRHANNTNPERVPQNLKTRRLHNPFRVACAHLTHTQGCRPLSATLGCAA
jgi:hypothetical protein